MERIKLDIQQGNANNPRIKPVFRHKKTKRKGRGTTWTIRNTLAKATYHDTDVATIYASGILKLDLYRLPESTPTTRRRINEFLYAADLGISVYQKKKRQRIKRLSNTQDIHVFPEAGSPVVFYDTKRNVIVSPMDIGMIRKSVLTWIWVATRHLQIPKDIRIIIAKGVWESRKEENVWLQ